MIGESPVKDNLFPIGLGCVIGPCLGLMSVLGGIADWINRDGVLITPFAFWFPGTIMTVGVVLLVLDKIYGSRACLFCDRIDYGREVRFDCPLEEKEHHVCSYHLNLLFDEDVKNRPVNIGIK
jgi:hypothetical protein